MPKSKKNKIEYQQVRVNLKPEDMKILSNICKSKGISKSEYIRQKIDLHYEEARTPKKIVSYKRVNPKLLYEINKIGININQLAERANRKKSLDLSILVVLEEIREKINEIS